VKYEDKIRFPNGLLIRDNISFAVYIISSAKEKTIPLYVSVVISFARQKVKD
jgi:hypothetical protein